MEAVYIGTMSIPGKGTENSWSSDGSRENRVPWGESDSFNQQVLTIGGKKYRGVAAGLSSLGNEWNL